LCGSLIRIFPFGLPDNPTKKTMKIKFGAIILPVLAFAAPAISVQLPAAVQAVRSSDTHIIEFDASGAATVTSPACGGSCGTQAFGNNDLGAIVGSCTDVNVVPHGFLRTPNGAFISFDAPGAGLGS
jgi:hypothetical protein